MNNIESVNKENSLAVEIDRLVTDGLVPLRNITNRKAMDKYPLFGLSQTAFFASGKRLGLQITDQGHQVAGYTLIVDGTLITAVVAGVSRPHIGLLGFLPLKPLFIIELPTLRAMVADKDELEKNPFWGFKKYMGGIKVRWYCK